MPLTFLQYITPSRLGGAEYFFLRLVPHLLKCGHRVLVVTKRDTPLRPEVEKLIPLGVELHAWHTHGKFDPQTLSKLVKLIKTERVDIINTHLTTATWQGALAGKLTNRPVVAFVHATDRKTWFQHADHLIAVSQGVRASLLEQGVPDKKIDVLFYGINLEKYVPPLSKIDAKIRLGIEPGARTIGVAASLIPRKGHRYLLEALKNIQPRTGPIHAIFAGEGELDAELKKQTRDLGLEDTVHFLGFRRDMPEILCAMDAFVLPSFKEGLSIAVMEAMALEIPVVVTNIAGMPEVVHHGETGLLVSPGNVPELGEAVESVFTLPKEAERMAKNGRTFLEQHFEQHVCLDAMERYFHRIARQWEEGPEPESQIVPAFSKNIEKSPAGLHSLFNLPPVENKKPLTILQYITPSRIGGAERYFLRLVTHLAEQGHRIVILTKRDTPLRHELEKLIENGVRLELHAWHTHGKVDPQTLGKLVSLIKSEGIDVVNTHLTTASWIGSLAGRAAGVPVVARVPATERPRFYSFADFLIAVSHGVREHLIHEGVPAQKVAVFYNGIDLNVNRAPISSAAAKARLGLPEDARTVGVAASLIARKGHRFLLEAISKIEAEVGNIHLIFAGEGDQEPLLREQSKALGMEDRTHFLGFRRDILEIQCAMDVFVLPSLKEGLSNAVMEAMALERPVVVTNIAGMPEIVRNEKTGLLVPPGDVDALAGALRKLFDAPDFATQLGKNGRAFLEEHLEQKRCLQEVEDYLCRVAAWGEKAPDSRQ